MPNIFLQDERAAIMDSCRLSIEKEGKYIETPTDMWSYFVERTRINLHVFLCFSPIKDSFRERIREFPSIVNCCTIDWCENKTN